VVFDETAPEVVRMELAPEAQLIDGVKYLNGDTGAVPLTVWGFDEWSTVTGVKVVVEGADATTVPYSTVSASGQSVSYYGVVSLSAADGEKVVRVQLRDGAGNESELLSSEVMVDTQGPKLLSEPGVVVVEAVEGQIRSRRVTLEFYVGDDVAAGIDGPVRMRYGTGTAPASGILTPFMQRVTVDLTATHNEVVEFYGVFADRAGNEVVAQSQSYTMNLRGSIAGRVKVEGAQSETVGNGGVLVRAYLEGSDEEKGSGESISDGTYAINGLAEGTYRLVFSGDGMREEVRAGILVQAGQARDGGVVLMTVARDSGGPVSVRGHRGERDGERRDRGDGVPWDADHRIDDDTVGWDVPV
jgi:hypothetical protein